MSTPENLPNFQPHTLPLTDGEPIDAQILIGLHSFIGQAVNKLPGKVSAAASEKLIQDVTDVEKQAPLFSGRAFSYPAVSDATPELPEMTAESTVVSARRNLNRLVNNFGVYPFASYRREKRDRRAIEWTMPIFDDYEVRMRGAAGDSTFSLNFALGTSRPTEHGTRFNELWRTGIDTEEKVEGITGARFILTASGVKAGDTTKSEAFKRFRKLSGLMPQRMLAIVGLYAMRELEPDYAVALTLDGAINLSSLGKSRGICDYDGIFRDVGFRNSPDINWGVIPDFRGEGFEDALYRANLNTHEVETLDAIVRGLRVARAITPDGAVNTPPPLKLCSDSDPSMLEQELKAHLPRRMY